MKNYFTNTDPGTAKAFLISLSTVLAVLAIIFINPPLFANYDDINAITGTSIASDTTLSISLSTTSLSLDLTPTSSNGTFVSTADDDTKASTAVIHVATNNITGYTLGIKASNPVSSSADKLISNNEKCENTPTSNKCAISSLSQPVSSEDYIDNTVEGIDLNNTWGYAPSYYNSTPNTTTTTTLDPNTNKNITTTSPINYYPAPVNGDTIATTSTPNAPVDTNNNNDANNNTNNTNDIDPTAELQADEYTIDYGIRIDYTPYTGTYSTNYNNQSYIITAVGNPVPYSVSYNANKPTNAPELAAVDNLPNAQVGTVSSGDTVAVILSQKVPTIGTTNPTTGDYEYAGYVFNGWCTVQPQVPNEINGQPNTQGYQVCPVDQQQSDQARLFQPGDNFGIDQTVENTQILYAVWGAPAKVTFDGNGLAFNDATTDTANTVTYIPTYADGKITGDKANTIYSGTYKTPTLLTAENYIFKGWSEDQNATEATYTDEQYIISNINLNADDAINLYAVWTHTTVITFNKNGADGTETMDPQTIEAGTTAQLRQNTYTNTGYTLIGWNTTPSGDGESYTPQGDYTAAAESKNVTLYAQWEMPCPARTICYRGNNASSSTNMDNVTQYTTLSTIDRDVDLLASNFKKSGHGFVGWSMDKGAWSKLTDDDESNNPIIYGPNQTITVNNLTHKGINFYAIWAPAERDSNDNPVYLQNWQGCPNLTSTAYNTTTGTLNVSKNTITALTDNRDGKTYTIARLADGNCWMTENLRLDNSITYESTTSEFSESNTNNPALPLVNDYDEQITSNRLSKASFTWCSSGVSCYNESYLNIFNSARTTVSPEFTQNFTNSAHQDFDDNIFSYGNYYNWYSATAGNGKSETTTTTVAGDICPAGWKLPIGGQTNINGSFSHLDTVMGGTGDRQMTITAANKWRTFPNNYIYSGLWSGSSANNRGYIGYYWTSTADDDFIYAHTLSVYSNLINPGGGSNGKSAGHSVRCVITAQ